VAADRFRWTLDRAAPLLVGALQVATTYAASQRVTDRRPLDAVAFALLLTGPALLTARHRAPVLVLAGNLAASGLYYALGYRFGPAILSLVVAIVSAVVLRRRAAWLVTAAGVPAYLIGGALLGRQDSPGGVAVVAITAVLGLVLAGGEAVRVGRERRAETERATAAEHRRRAMEERLQVARDLHDVLAHHISLVSVQSAVALRLFDRDPAQSRAAITAIRQVSGSTLDDLRTMLAVLRKDHEPPLLTPPGLGGSGLAGSDLARPGLARSDLAWSDLARPGLARLGGLVERSAVAGLRITTTVAGAPQPLPPPADGAAFRIVQEAVTNVHRHTSATTATIDLAYTATALTLTIRDPGPLLAAPAAGPLSTGPAVGSLPARAVGGLFFATAAGGDGLAGMRERAEVLGGSLVAGPRPSGGFEVCARLPYRSGS
jgi:signal transduction histidine kinase